MKDECKAHMRHWVMMAVMALGFAGRLEASQPKRISMVVGHTITVSMPAPVMRVKLSDSSLVDVSQSGRNVKFVGRVSGVTDVVVTTSDGETRLQLYVASDKYALP
jgi:Flp pilus assembly secretin CpaC